jgi:hypothetical protein
MTKGSQFEVTVYELVQTELAAGRLGIMSTHASLYRQRGYFSPQRKRSIKFDIALEVRLPGVQGPFLLWLWECKKYGRPVDVGRVEEFHSKLQQVGADRTKGTFVTSSKFQASAIDFAKANGIGLVRVVPPGALSHVLAGMDRGPTQDELRNGLVSGRAASRDCELYALNAAGTYVADMEDFMAAELALIQAAVVHGVD